MPYSGSIQIVNDANGTAYAFLADNGLIWQCVWDAQSERWGKGQVVPGAEGGRELQALVVDDLWPTSGVSGAQQGNSPGIVLAYRVGSGSNSEVVASLGGWGSDGSLGWSEAVSLSNEQGSDEAFALVNSGNGRLRVVVQKREAETSAADLLLRLQEAPSELLSKELDQLASGTRPDSDLYVSDAQINADADGGGYALQLSGNGATTSTALSQAAAPGTVNQPGLPFAGTTELSRAALIANVVPPKTEENALSVLGVKAVGVAAPTEAGNSGVSGLGFTRWKQNPKSAAASLALFPARYLFSSAITDKANSLAGGAEAGDLYSLSERSSSVVNDSIEEVVNGPIEEVVNGPIEEVVDGPVDFEDLSRSERIANLSMVNIPNSEPLEVVDIASRSKSFLGGIELGRWVNGASEDGGAASSGFGSGLVLSGLFGGLLTGRGGYSVVNFATLKYDSGAAPSRLGDQQVGRKIANLSAGNPMTGGANPTNLTTTNFGVGFGGSFKTLFQYSGSGFAQKLEDFTAQESIGVYALLNQSRFRQNYTLHTDGSIAFSLLSQQRFSSSDGLPRALADVGLATGLAGDLLNLGNTIYGAANAPRFGFNAVSGSTLTGNGLGLSTERKPTDALQAIGILSGVLAVGSTIGVLSTPMRNNGSFSMGVGFQEALDLKVLSRIGVGVAAHLGSQQNWLWSFGDGWAKPDFQLLLFASAGVATIGGGYIPLINGSYVFNSKTQSDTSAGNGTTTALEGTALSEGTENAQPTSDGLLTLAPTGAETPFGYAPTAASDSLLNSNGSPLGSLTTRDSALFGFSLQSFDAGTVSEGVLSWGSQGSNLNDGSYSNVPLIGLSLLGSLPAVASFTVSNGSVDPTTLQVSVSDGAGQYLGLPSPSSGIYSFGIDVFAARADNPAPPSAANMSSVLDAMPVINLQAASVKPGSPLQVTSLQRIQQQVPLSGLSQSGSYPLADGSAPASNNPSVYTYSAVPVQLLADASKQEQVVLLNQDATATVKLSGGSIIGITLDQDLYFNDNTGGAYTLVIDLASQLPGSSITNPTAVVTAQNLSLNDFSEQDSFSANAGQQGAGVFLSSGLSDQMGLLPSFGAFPIQNRVSYIDGETIVYLNNTAGESNRWSAVYPSDVSLERLYTNPGEYQFTTASSPTAITEQASDTTYVFWVEAADPVIPLTGDNGADNYQQFLNAYWNNQRINYSYATTSEVGSNTIWHYLNEDALYAPEGNIITDLRSFSVELDGKTRSLLVWTEVPIEALQQALSEPDQLAQSQLAVIKTGLINPDADAIPGGYQWNLLFNDASGSSTIREVPWSAARDSGLTISDLSAANLTVEINGEAQLTPILSWSQAVRTPYNEAVLQSQPVLFVPFAALQPGYNTLNQGAAGDANTQTFASSTGLNSAVRGPLPKSAATAVLNEEGLGVLATGLGSFNSSLLQIARNAPQSSAEPVVALFEGSIADHTLTVSSLSQGTLKVGDLLVGDGVTANSRIKEVVTAATSSSPGTYRLDLSSTVATPTSLRTLPIITNVPLSTFSGSFSGSGGEAGFTTLTLSGLVGSIQIGDRVLGLGLPGGVTVQEVTEFDLDAGTATLMVDQGPATSDGTYGLASIPGGTSSPYTIEFWTQLAKDSNPAGAGLVGLGQASSTALPDRPVELPDGWLLSSGFAVERLTWQDALNQSLVSALPSDESASDLYGWRWGLVATGTNTTAMDGTGGSNISRNALVLANLAVGDTIEGVNTFLANYGLSASDLAGIDGTPADQIASTPSTEFNFATDLVFNTAANTEVATTSLNAVSVLTDSALMNAGFLSAAEAQANSNLSTMLETLWTFQQETGEVKVNFDLKPTDPNTNQTPATPPVSQQENYAGFALEFALLPGPSVSVNGNGQIAYDVADGITLLSDESVDYRDGQWHYVAVSFLPDYTSVVAAGTLFEVPSNVGTASLYINGELVASQSNVIDPFAPSNLNDNAQLLADNGGGAIDLLAFYDQALTTLQSPAAAEGWAMPTSTDALELMQEAGYVFEGRTPHPGEQPGAISNHYLAHTVDPNDALEATFTTVLLPQADGGYNWSEATTLSPQLEIRPTDPSASNQNLADALLIPISAGDWQKAGWFVGSSSNAVPFNPANRELESIAVVLTPSATANADTIKRTLTPSDVLLGSTSAGNLTSLETVQPFSTNSTDSLQYRFLSSQPALNLQISKAADSTTGDSGTLNREVSYTAQVTFTFTDSTVVSNVSGDGSQGLALGFSPNVGSTLAYSPSFGSTLQSTVLNSPTALATAQVIEQAPLQLKYIDSGVQFTSQVSPANPSPASTFGASQVYGSFADPVNSGKTAGWIAIAQPRSSNASSDPAGRVWIQYAGSFAFNSTTNKPERVSAGIAPTTWLNALSTSTFSPDQPNLPLLSNAFNPSQVGGLLIKADPTDGWGQNLGANMLVADVNNDGVDDLVLSAPQANGGGSVVIIAGEWIQNNLNQATGETILDLSNPDNLGAYVTILTPGVVDTNTDLATVAGFGSALSFVPGEGGQAGYLLVGAPNYLRILDSSNEQASTQPIGALYSYQYNSESKIWGSGIATPINALVVGTGGTLTIPQAGNGTTTDYWGAQLGTSIAVASDGGIAVSSPGVMGAAIYSGTEVANERVNQFKINASSRIPEGLLTQVQIGQSAIDTTLGLNNPGLQPVTSLQENELSDQQIDFLNQLRDLQNSQVADATTLNNQAIQYGAFGAVTLFGSITELQTMASGLNATDLTGNPAAVGAAGGQTFYGPNLFNTLGDSGFGSSLAFVDLVNSAQGSQLVVGAEQAGGGGMVYVLDPSLLSSATSLGHEQYFAFDAATNLISAAAEGDYLGSGLINLGDVNQDGYEDLLMQAYNADSSAGNAYLLFGSDQLGTTVANRGSTSLATGSIGTMNFVDGKSIGIATLSELGQSGSLAGQGVYGPGDYNADGYPDLPLGSGIMGKSYITYGHPYLESINNLELSRLASNTGFMLDGLATTTQGSLRSIGDFNGDGYGDFMSINPGPVATTVRIELGANTQNILAEALYNDYTFTVSLDTQVLSAGDLNGDGLDDIALFINSNLASEAEGNFGAGSTTGILYGRSSGELPVGSGFGFLSPVAPDGQPLASLPSLSVAGGLSDVAPSFIAAGTTIYAAVKGNGASDTSIWFTQSKDAGSTWADWVDLSNADIGLSTSTTPSLALFNNTLYLGLATTDGLVVSSWDPASSDLTDWSQPQQVATATTTLAPQLLDRGDSLGVIWVDEDGELMASSSTEPGAQNVDWTTPIQLKSVASSGTSPITSTTAASYTWLGTTPVLAVNNGSDIEVYAAIGTGSGLQLISTFEAAQAGSTITSAPSAPVITATDTGLALSYTNSDSSVSLARLDLLNDGGEPLPGVVIDANGVLSINTNDLTWSITTLNAANSGISTNLATSPLSINGNLLLANIRTDTQFADQIWIDLIPNLPDAAINPWINSTIQLPDGNGGWLISQTDANAVSTLTAVGDLSGDGIDDLIVSNALVSVATLDTSNPWSALGNGASSLASPALAQLGDVLYMAVQSNTGGNNIYWSSSSDNGVSWADFQALPTGMTSVKPPSIAVFDDTLYLSYLDDGNNEINITSLTDPGTNSWSKQYLIPWSGGSQSALYASLVAESVDGNDQLALYYISNDADQSELLRTATATPASSSGWTQQINIEYNSGSANQTASGPLAVVSSNGQTVIAYQGGTITDPSNEIYFATSSTPSNSASWSAQSVLDPDQQTGLGLVDSGTHGLLLSYSDKTVPAALQLQSFEYENGSWTNTKSLSTPLMASGSSDVSILRSTATAAETIVFAGINASNSNALEVKLASTTTSNTGVRLINGAGSPQAFAEINDPTALQQTIQLAPALSSTKGVGTISASVTAAGTLSLNALSTTDAYGVSGTFTNPAALVASSTSIASSQQLFSDAFAPEAVGWSSTPTSSPTGDLALNTTTSFGDLNGDGYNDYFDPQSSIWIASAPEAPVFSLWSIRAAGDVNGNGVDDVLLALTPQGPSYPAQSDGSPSAIYSALIDGDLFNVTIHSNPNLSDVNYGTFNLSDLKAALNPYNSAELFDVTTLSTSDEYQSRQNWFSPILKYQAPIKIQSVQTLVTGNSAFIGSAQNSFYNNSPAPTLVHDASGNLYSITTQVIGGGINNGILLSNTLLLGVGQNSLDPNAIQVTAIDLTQASPLTTGGTTLPGFPAGSIAPLTPGAAIHDGKLFVAIPSTSGVGYGATNNIWIAYADLNNPNNSLTDASSWTTYQVQSNGGTSDEYTLLTPTLVSEGERLALYFPSGDEGNNDENLNIHYLYSNDPTQQTAWGSSFDSATNTYNGTSSTITIDASLSKTPSTQGWASSSGVIVTSPISATTYQGRTVLAFRGYGEGAGDNVENGALLLAFAPTAVQRAKANIASSSSTTDWTLWDTGTTGINTPSIATDQANLYLTYTPWSTSATNAQFFPVALNIDQLAPNKQVTLNSGNLITAGATYTLPITLQQAGDDTVTNDGNIGMTSPYYAGGYFKDADTLANNIGNAPQSVTPSFFGDVLYVTNQIGESAAVSIDYSQSEAAFGSDQINQAGFSLAGYSIDGNIDVNGDGFTDILLSDPSDPSLDVDNQYVLFGGDYLDIANWVGTAGNDVAVGTPLADVIYTIAGDDAVTSNGGADVIYTGAGADAVSITGNSFIRIDTGSGIDQLLLEGDANQAYDFRLDVKSPEYFAGTKLRNIELIISLGYGANTLSFDPGAVSAFNDDRMLFVIPDASDIINLYSDPNYSFQRNSDYDTSFGGVVWNAYASVLTSGSTSLDPALLYVLNPAAGDDTWLDGHVDLATTVLPTDISSFALSTDADASVPVSAAQLPKSSAVASQQDFGNGLRLTAFKDGPSSGVSRFVVSRNDSRFRQVVAYASRSANSSVEPGLDTSAIAGQLVLEPGESSQLITVPFDQERIALQRQAGISLQVEEVLDVGQQELHLVISSQTGNETSGDLLSGFQLDPIVGSQASVLSFRLDTETPDDRTPSALLSSSDRSADSVTTSATLGSEPSPSAAELIVHRRPTADGSISDPRTVSQLITVSDATPEVSAPNFDHDGFKNQQVGIELLLNTQPGSNVVSLITTDSHLAPLTALGSIPQPTPPEPGPSPAPTPRPQLESPINSSGSVNYAVINSGLADFSATTPDYYAEINWAEVDFSAIAQSSGSAESLNYGLINYSEISTAESFSALAEIIQYDDLTGSNIREIAANTNSQGSFDVVIGERGENLRQQGSGLNDLFQVRGGGRLVARGGGGRDLYYSNSKSAEMVIKDFSSEDLAKLDRFGDRAVRKGKLQIFQDGDDAVISFKGNTMLTLRNTEADQLAFSQGSITLTADPLA